MLTETEKADLLAYFTQDVGVFGAKSSLGPQLEALSLGVLGIHYAAHTEDALHRRLDTQRDGLVMARRLSRLTRDQVEILQAQVLGTHTVKGLAVEALALAPVVRRVHAAYLGALPLDQEPKTRLEWLAWLTLQAKKHKIHKVVLQLAIAQAKEALDGAIAAFRRTGQQEEQEAVLSVCEGAV